MSFMGPVKKFADNKWWVNERIVENAFIHRNLPPPGQKTRVLDFGCTRSLLPYELASIGYEVVGVDLRPIPFSVERFSFRRGDLRKVVQPDEFDMALSVSVIEHIGIGAYGEPAGGTSMRNQVLQSFVSSVKGGGRS